MNDMEILAIVSCLKLFHKSINALEWGSGNSTLNFSTHLPRGSTWLSIEHDDTWANKVKKFIAESGNTNVMLYYIPASDDWRERGANYDTFRDYILFPTSLRKKFHLILVDGRARAECMQIGWMILDSSGIMILHDAQRMRYKKGIPSDCFFLKMSNPHITLKGENISVLFVSKSSYAITLLSDILKNKLPDYINFEMDSYSLLMSKKRVSWKDLKDFTKIKLYAGDVPDLIEYEGLIGLSLSQNNYRHILHDITKPFPLPDDSIDSFQAEDVLEHISYEKLASVINEIFRILKPNGLFRLSLPDYGCDVLQNRSIKEPSGQIVFDPSGGGTFLNPGHIWFPRIDNVKSLLDKTAFSIAGKIEYFHYYNMDGTFIMKPIDYLKGHVRRTPDFDTRVQDPRRPMSIVVDLVKT